MKRTALFEEHVRLQGRLVDFGGWELPVQYTGVMDEHQACRTAVGLFDVSHMGEVLVEGKDAEAYLNRAVTNDVSKIAVGQAQYTAMCNERGGIVDDLVIYRLAKERFLVVVNASNTDKDFAHLQALERQFGFADLSVQNRSAEFSQIAVQGRHAAALISKVTTASLSGVKTYWFTEGKIGEFDAIIARTGYTGEDGFEIYVPWSAGPAVWRALLAAGASLGVKACGLGARDTLRLEMKYALYGHELSDETNALEAGLGWVTKLEKPEFVGRAALMKVKEAGPSRKLVGIRLLDRGIPRQGYPIFDSSGQRIGEVTSGTQSPSLGIALGIAYIRSDLSAVGSRVMVEIRGVKIPAEVIPTPFYKRPYAIPN
jgi:aminomethyltransferase